ncbi:hypothetical protein [Pelagimonas varians]|uniref:Uncharacterized protein n=1 Tax=Pelagimonas varians TaxID=696760 RepID=A0A238L1I9_9RHOB|nr:hypothetical protein [Pelagimonas varians]PYG26890.1 hypothetical protein C8N36_11981 [Pelagimonas varians]SMX48954.1 hypothetical protein PEV8663_04036 [Pelagimonas varians]
MIEIAHTRQMERAIKLARAERSAAFAAVWTRLFSFRPKFHLRPKPQAVPAG